MLLGDTKWAWLFFSSRVSTVFPCRFGCLKASLSDSFYHVKHLSRILVLTREARRPRKAPV